MEFVCMIDRAWPGKWIVCLYAFYSINLYWLCWRQEWIYTYKCYQHNNFISWMLHFKIATLLGKVGQQHKIDFLVAKPKIYLKSQEIWVSSVLCHYQKKFPDKTLFCLLIFKKQILKDENCWNLIYNIKS